MRARTAVSVMTVTAALGGVSMAIAQSRGIGVTPEPVPLDAAAGTRVPPGRGNVGAEHQTSTSALRDHLERAGAEYVSDSDWESARSFSIPGTQLRGWTFDQPGERCLAIPDPVAEGYGVSCRTRAEIERGEASVVMLPPATSGAPNIVGVLTIGEATARLESSSAGVHWARIGDVYAGTAPAGSRLVTADRSQMIKPPPDVASPLVSPSG